MIGEIRTGLLSASLSFLLTVASGAQSGDTETQPERSLDLTGSYQELRFTGSIHIEESGDECLYEIPALTIGFIDTYRPFPTAVQLDQFRIVVFAPGAASKPKALSSPLLERNYPLAVSLSSSAREFHALAMKFTVPKRLMRDAEYLALGFLGRLIRLDGKYHYVDPSERARLQLEGRRVAWPLPARLNVISMTTDPNGERGKVTYRTPLDPNDDCSSAKIR
jgi:hypothetical protein